jgi:hypothetical protein
VAKREIYVSIDIEADGPIPGQNSMLNFGAAAFDVAGPEPLVPIATFEANLKPIEGAAPDADTMAWWGEQPEAHAYVSSNQRAAATVMPEFVAWAVALPGNPVLVSYPAYDFMWIHWYIMRFGAVKRSPFSFAALDTKTLAMVALDQTTFKGTSKRAMFKQRPEWFDGQPEHDHTGLTDAIGQGMLFVRILAELRGR